MSTQEQAAQSVAPSQVLIPIHSDRLIGGVPTVNARDLYTFLRVGRDFSNWIKDRIRRFKFQENQDFVIDSPNLANQKDGRGGDRRSQEYHLTLDMAKELAMVENNAKGREARRYFIEAEKRLRSGLDEINTLRAQLDDLRAERWAAFPLTVAWFRGDGVRSFPWKEQPVILSHDIGRILRKHCPAENGSIRFALETPWHKLSINTGTLARRFGVRKKWLLERLGYTNDPGVIDVYTLAGMDRVRVVLPELAAWCFGELLPKLNTQVSLRQA
ncbi:MAG: antA/AntB antirepressor family protein [Magnetococcales bacterium]|nr:antA/AntB antirepressor family protein [Magnetococcales bacterium]